VPALDDPQTRAALGALRVGALRWLGGGVVAVVLGFLMGAAVVRIVENGGACSPWPPSGSPGTAGSGCPAPGWS
jgi:hypothetical protein